MIDISGYVCLVLIIASLFLSVSSSKWLDDLIMRPSETDNVDLVSTLTGMMCMFIAGYVFSLMK